MEKNIYTEKEYFDIKTRAKKGEILPMYCKMVKGKDVIYAVLMDGYYEAAKMGYKYID